jgi:hypothetical protein
MKYGIFYTPIPCWFIVNPESVIATSVRCFPLNFRHQRSYRQLSLRSESKFHPRANLDDEIAAARNSISWIEAQNKSYVIGSCENRAWRGMVGHEYGD